MRIGRPLDQVVVRNFRAFDRGCLNCFSARRDLSFCWPEAQFIYCSSWPDTIFTEPCVRIPLPFSVGGNPGLWNNHIYEFLVKKPFLVIVEQSELLSGRCKHEAWWCNGVYPLEIPSGSFQSERSHVVSRREAIMGHGCLIRTSFWMSKWKWQDTWVCSYYALIIKAERTICVNVKGVSKMSNFSFLIDPNRCWLQVPCPLPGNPSSGQITDLLRGARLFTSPYWKEVT